MAGVVVIVALTLGLVIAGLVEFSVHARRLVRIPIRLHINGTRGKSSVTRLIAGGLREAGVPTCAKTSGTLPRMIMPDGSEYAVFRPARANVIEQIRILEIAASCGAKAVVIECMALQPFLQWLSEWKLVRATMAVITNVRADHLDVMGPSEHDVALALAGTIPRRKKLATAERRHLAVLTQCARDRETEVVAVGEQDIAAVTAADLAGFSYVEHAENVALALRVCHELGVDRRTALAGMQRARPDPGVMTTHEIEFFGRTITFVNGFAANDPESSQRIWEMAINRFPGVQRRIAIINCRADRPGRSQQLGRASPGWTLADHYLLIGTGTYIFARAATLAGLDSRKMVFAEGQRPDDVFEICVELAGRSALVMGLGNIGGPGLSIISYFRNRSRSLEDA